MDSGKNGEWQTPGGGCVQYGAEMATGGCVKIPRKSPTGTVVDRALGKATDEDLVKKKLGSSKIQGSGALERLSRTGIPRAPSRHPLKATPSGMVMRCPHREYGTRKTQGLEEFARATRWQPGGAAYTPGKKPRNNTGFGLRKNYTTSVQGPCTANWPSR